MPALRTDEDVHRRSRFLEVRYDDGRAPWRFVYLEDRQLEFRAIAGDHLLVVGHRGSVSLYDLDARSRQAFVPAPDPEPDWPFVTGAHVTDDTIWVGFRGGIKGYHRADLTPLASLGAPPDLTLIGPPTELSQGRVAARARCDPKDGEPSWGVLVFDVEAGSYSYVTLQLPISEISLEPGGGRVAWILLERGDEQTVELRLVRTNLETGNDEGPGHLFSFDWRACLGSNRVDTAKVLASFALLTARKPGLFLNRRLERWRRDHAAAFGRVRDVEEAALTCIETVMGAVFPSMAWGPDGSTWLCGGDALYVVDARGDAKGGFRLPAAARGHGLPVSSLTIRPDGGVELEVGTNVVDVEALHPPGSGRLVDVSPERCRVRKSPSREQDGRNGRLQVEVDALDDDALARAIGRAASRFDELAFLVSKDLFRLEFVHGDEHLSEPDFFERVGLATPHALEATRRLVEKFAAACAVLEEVPWYDNETPSLSFAARALALRGGNEGLHTYCEVYLPIVDLEHDVFHQEVLLPQLGEAGQELLKGALRGPLEADVSAREVGKGKPE